MDFNPLIHPSLTEIRRDMHTLPSLASADPGEPSELELDRPALERALGEQLNVLLSASRALVVKRQLHFIQNCHLQPSILHIDFGRLVRPKSAWLPRRSRWIEVQRAA